MLNKVINIIKENKVFIIIYVVILLLLLIRLPYVIYAPSSLTNIEDRIEVENNYKLKGSFNTSAVREIKATPFNCLLAFINSWDILEDKSYENEEKGDRILLDSSFDNAILASFKDDSIIKDSKMYVAYIYDEAETDLKVGDKLIKVNGKKIKTKDDITNITNRSKENDIITWEIEREGKILNKTTKIKKYNNILVNYLYIVPKYVLETNPKIKAKFDPNEVGSSGALMFSLYIYSKVNKIDLTNGKIVAGTGTISDKGIVGDIDGVKYKLRGAVESKADIFLVHNGTNYDEAIKEKQKNKYDIKIYGVDNLEEAINILKKAS